MLNTDDDFNYAAYLLADNNSMSIKVAKYNGLDRVELIESNDYGFCCLVKSCKHVLDKLIIENTVETKITHKERVTKALMDPIALREAVINAIRCPPTMLRTFSEVNRRTAA